MRFLLRVDSHARNHSAHPQAQSQVAALRTYPAARSARAFQRRTVLNAVGRCRLEMSMENGRVLAPFLYAWVSEDECAPDLRGLQSRPRPTAIPPAIECRSATRFTPRLRAASRSGDDARPPPTPP